MEAFIVRPFGEKNGVNFDQVEKKLIIPALEKAGIKGYTTGVILEAGNIRQDMFQLLLTCDLVVADISIHNANVFYELGIRHALRSAKTVLIRCRKDEVPFDLKTDRYLTYDQKDPASDVELLCEGLKQTINSDRTDSPVFLMLPKLRSQNSEDFLVLPADFSKEVFIAKETKQRSKLALMASEVQFFSWKLPALRLIAEIQFMLKFYEDAKKTWETILEKKPNDIIANERLATIYHRLAEMEEKRNPEIEKELLAKSEQSINNMFDQFKELDRNKRAEAYTLRARNEKTLWVKKWVDADSETIGAEAIKSNLLQDAYKNYSLGFHEDLNHFYSGVNALGLLKTIILLAEKENPVWASKFDSIEEANRTLNAYACEFDNLAIVVRRAVESEQKALENKAQMADSETLEAIKSKRAWVNMTLADIALLTSNSPEQIGDKYSTAIESGTGLNFDAALRQLLLYSKLNVMSDNLAAAIKEFMGNPILQETDDKEVILFAGHMIDKKNRKKPRFPKKKESKIRELIKGKLTKIMGTSPLTENFVGIAGGACGGDILFHEVCKELGIKTEMFLALPAERFIVESVEFAGNSWVKRFYRIYKDVGTAVQILSEDKELPTWLRPKANYTFWERSNLWILNSALLYGSRNLTFLALWDGQKGDGPGGTKHMMKEVKKIGAKSIVIPTD